MTGVEKAAILFRVLGADFALPMCELMDPEEVSVVGEAMVRFEKTPPSEQDVETVLGEFKAMMSDGGIFANVNDTLNRLFAAKFGPEKGPTLLQEARVCAQVESPFEALMRVGFDDLRRLLSEEHPQVQAAVLANIGPELAAGVLDSMDREERRGVLERIATMKPPSPRLLQDIAELFIEKSRKLPRSLPVDKTGPKPSIKRVADIFNAASPDTKELLDGIEEEEPELAEEIRDTMFTFNDLQIIDKITMQKILGGIDSKLLALALKSCPDHVRDAIFAAVSQRTMEMILEERDLMGAVPLLDVHAAQKEIVTTIRGMADGGAIVLNIGGAGATLVE